MSTNLRSEIDTLLEERPHLEEQVEVLVEIDENNGSWSFDDIPLDSGDFGELVERGIVTECEGGYAITDREALKTALSGENLEEHTTSGGVPADHVVDFFNPDEFQEQFTTKITNNQIIVSVVLLTAIAFVFRIHNLSEVPLLDGEALIGLASMGILEHGDSLFPSGIRYHRGPLVLHITALSIAIFGENAFALRLPFALAGTLTIPLTYLLGSEVKGHRTGVIASALVAFTALHIAWSRTARFYIFLQLFIIVCAYSYFKYSANRQEWWYLLIFIFSLLAAYFSHSGWRFVLVFVGVGLVTPKLEKLSVVDAARVGAILLGILIMLTVHLTGSFPFLDSLIELTGISVSGEFETWRHPHSELPPSSFFTSYFPLLTGVAVLSTLLSLKNRERELLTVIGFVVVSVWILTYVGGQIRHVWRPRYLFFLLPFFLLIVAAALAELTDALADVLSSRTDISSSVARSGTAVLFVGVMIISPVPMELGVTADEHSLSQLEEPQPNYLAACEAIEDDIREDDIVITNRPAQASFWLDKVDYRGNTVVSNITGNNEDRFTGAPAIQNKSHMRDVIDRHDRVWVIYNPFMPLKNEEWIRSNLTRYAEAETPFSTRVPHSLYEKMIDRGADETVYVYTKEVTEGTSQHSASSMLQTRC